MTQLSSVPMQPSPSAAECLTLIEKLRNRHKEWSLNTNYWMDDNLIRDVFNDAINIVKQHNDWVSVDERFPNDGDIVEVYRNSYKWGDLVWQCLYTAKHGFRNYPAGTVGKNDKITHWRAIKPPSEVQGD